MRIKFLKDTEVELKNVPPTAWGAVQKRHSTTRPEINPDTGAFHIPASGPLAHFFPFGLEAELPDDVAEKFIAAENAEQTISPLGEVTWTQ